MHQRDQLIMPFYQVLLEFSRFDEVELRTTALDVVARKSQN